MYNKLLARLYRLESNRVYSSIKNGFMLIIPLVMIGSFAILLQNLPIPPLLQFLKEFAGGLLFALLQFIFYATVGLLSLYLVLSISYYYSDSFAQGQTSVRVYAMFTALACFIASFGVTSGDFTIAHFGTTGVFTALLCAIASTRLFFAIREAVERHTRGNELLEQTGHMPIFSMLACILVFALLNLLLSAVFHVSDFNQLFSNAFTALFAHIHNELAGGVVFTFLQNALWIFGIHGGNAMDATAQTVFGPAASVTRVFSKSFFDNFAVMGGSGASLSLLIALLIASRSRRNRRLARASAPMVFFNINELLVFGLPVVLNPILAIPFILAPLCSLLIGYGAVVLGLMPAVTNTVFWTTPPLLSGYLATGSIAGTVVQVVILAAGTAIYLPFVRLAERAEELRTTFYLEQLIQQFQEEERGKYQAPLLTRSNSLGVIAKSMVTQLRSDISENLLPICYQPQLDSSGQVVGVEALLRWKYAGKIIYPPLAIALAKEDGCFDLLTMCVFHLVCQDAKELRREPGGDLHIAVNLSAEQLGSLSFVEHLIAIAQEHGVSSQLVLEVTEETSLQSLPHIAESIELLHQNGLLTAIDDFSMGQTSLDYLRNNRFQYVKLDGSLVRQVTHNQRVQEIISSILALGRTLQFQVIAEQVENSEIRDALAGLGCTLYQGFLYSPAIPLDILERYCLAETLPEKEAVIREHLNR